MAIELATAYVSLVPSARGMADGIARELSGTLESAAGQAGDDGASGFFSRFQSRAGGLASAAGKAVAVGLGAGLVGAAVVGRGFVNAASDMNETVSKSNTIFGDSAGEIRDWSSTAARSFGQSQQQALDAAGTFGNMFTQLGIGSDQAAGMSKSMVGLASDFASFHNADVSDVLDAQTAAFRGEYDAVQRFVPTINAAAVQQRALQMTGKATTDSLTDQEKALATNALLMEGAGSAVGDFARTSDGVANKQRILTAQWHDMQASIGQALLPAMQALVSFASERLLPALSSIGSWMSNNKSTVLAIGAGIGTVLVGAVIAWGIATWQAVAANIALGTSMLPMIATVGAIALAIGALVGGVIYAYTHFETFRTIVDGTIDAVGTAIAGFVTAVTAAWSAFGDNILAFVTETWDGIRTYVDGALTAIKGIVDVFVGLFTGDWGRAWDGVKAIFSGVWEALAGIVAIHMTALKLAVTVPLEALDLAWRAVWGGIRDFFGAVWDTMKGAASSGVDALVGIVGAIPERITSVLSGAWDALTSGFRAAMNVVIDGINAIHLGSIEIGGWDIPGPGPNVPSFHTPEVDPFPDIPRLAEGALAFGPTMALIGDNPRARFDPEVIAPLSRLEDVFDRRLEPTGARLQVNQTINHVGPESVMAEAERRYKVAQLLYGGT